MATAMRKGYIDIHAYIQTYEEFTLSRNSLYVNIYIHIYMVKDTYKYMIKFRSLKYVRVRFFRKVKLKFNACNLNACIQAVMENLCWSKKLFT